MILTDRVFNKYRLEPLTSCVPLRHLSSLGKKILKISSYPLAIAPRESEEVSTYHFQHLSWEVVYSRRKKREGNGCYSGAISVCHHELLLFMSYYYSNKTPYFYIQLCTLLFTNVSYSEGSHCEPLFIFAPRKTGSIHSNTCFFPLRKA